MNDYNDLLSPANCLCFNLQRAGRRVARELDRVLKPSDLSAQQFATLAALNGHGEMRISDLAEYLGAERTTLTRNLNRLDEAGQIELFEGEDRRERFAALSAEGRRTLARALPIWRRFQKNIIGEIGDDAARALIKILAKTA